MVKRFMSQTEIAKELGCTRANVGQTLQRAIKKMYKEILEKQVADSSYEAFQAMSVMLNATDQKDVDELFNKMPTELQKDIQKDAKKVHYM